MKKLTLLIFYFFLHHSLHSQVAIIQDKDGYTNVRKEAGVHSEVIYQLKDNEVFFYYEQSFDENVDDSKWVYVMIPRNKFSIITNYDNPYYYGYIHRSRLLPLHALEKIPYPQKDELIFQIKKVDTLQKKIDELIDGYITYGIDIYLHHSTEVSALDLYWDGMRYPQADVLIGDLYNVDFEEGEYRSSRGRFDYYKAGDHTFLVQECADGGGHYLIVWTVKGHRIVQRLVGTHY